MNGKRLKEVAQEFKDDEEIIVYFWSKEEADEYLQEYEESDDSAWTDEEWIKITDRMDNDNYLHQVLAETWSDILHKFISGRENNGNNQ